ncbi:TonB family protein [Sulfurimonas sp. HSL3-2]|uniref:energy transducer TonB n=1 Tax=Hydrocurvibacter mobilis TaxID=3131936 RepID=UPI0031F9EA67
MIRHSSSFSISLVVHIIILVLALFIYNYALSDKHEKRIAVDVSKCIMNCDCGCLPKVEKEAEKEAPKLQKPVEKKALKKVEKKPVKKEPKKVLEPEETMSVTSEKAVVEEKPEPEEISDPVDTKVLNAESPLADKKLELTNAQDEVTSEEAQKAIQRRYINENESKIAQMIKDNLYYPQRAQKRRIQGMIVVKFTLLKNREIKDVIITKHSHDILDKSALRTIQNLQGKLPAPMEDIVLVVPINYRLN